MTWAGMMDVKRLVGRIGHIYPLRKVLVKRGRQDKAENKK